VESEKYTAIVADQVRWEYQIGVTDVPTYVINHRYAVFRNALARIMNHKD
jgi:hypothetical protein